MTVAILHLSDIHIKSDSDPILLKAKDIASCIFKSLPTASHVVIVVSGDIAYSGKPEQYALAEIFLEEIKKNIQEESDKDIIFILTPGNHDCDFSKNNSVRDILISTLENQEYKSLDDNFIQTCTSIQEDFFKFRESIEKGQKTKGDNLWRTTEIEVDGKKLVFDSLNISWVSRLEENSSKLIFPFERYKDNADEACDVRILTLHHPLNWFNQIIYRPFRRFIRKVGNIVISGHEHEGNVGIITETETDTSAFVEGCALQGHHGIDGSAFNIIILDLKNGKFSATQYELTSTSYTPKEEASWADYKELPSKRNSQFMLTEEFQSVLDDPGGFFKHPFKAKISLSDIYIYPDLRKIGLDDGRRRVFNSSHNLRNPEYLGDGALIEGEEKSGCSSLIYQLYKHYYEIGYTPLLIKGKEIKKVADREIAEIIQRAVITQYGQSAVNLFEQQSKKQKILFIDGLDRSPIKSAEARASVCTAFRNRFKHLIVTVGEMFELREMLNSDTTRSLSGIEHYKMQPFGHVLRGQLITRWLSLGSDGTIDEAGLIAQRDQAERLIGAIMQKNVIPSLPLYLLTLLQSIGAGHSGDFKESALGHYYQYLLTEAFQQSGIKADKLNEIFQYSTRLAWYFHTLSKRELSDLELRKFNDDFTKQWHTVDFSKQLDVLLEARVLCKAGEDYAFRYPYIYYFLKGKYISDNLSDISIREYITHCCNHLYVRDYANTILFLAHHSTDNFVLESISLSLKNPFRDQSPIRFNGDTGLVSELIAKAPQLTYSGESPAAHRDRQNALQDQLDNGQDGLAEKEEDSTELSLVAQLTMLFKTTDILGQVLKNQYSQIHRARKQELVGQIFDGPLRAVATFYNYFNNNPDALLSEIEFALQKKGDVENPEVRKAIAQKVVANIIQFVTYGFLMRAAQSAGSDPLLEDVNSVVKLDKSAAYRLIELGIILDSPKDIPHQKLEALFKEIKNDPVAGRVLQIMVLNHLYMFKTKESDMQWINSCLEINLDMQHAIAYQEKRSKLTN